MLHLRPLLALLVILILNVSFAVPAEDVPETSYDESQSLPFDRIPVVSIGAGRVFASTPAVTAPGSKLILICGEKDEISRLVFRAGLRPLISNSLTTLYQSFRC